MLIDSSAWLEYFMGTAQGEKVRDFVEGGGVLYTTPVVMAEVLSKSIRTDGMEKGKERVDFISERCVVVPLDEDMGRLAGAIHGEMKKKDRTYGMMDALILAAARKRGIKVLTKDRHFKGLDEGVMLE
ncbi:MAG: type II toxin-antitoxin system VapC family toxin [Euryarchaeota archaeon]|nr:type II toxin-antitoxin system VapC family toxin [Euryarchaeota archaeon]